MNSYNSHIEQFMSTVLIYTTFLGAWDISMNKTGKNLCPSVVYIFVGKSKQKI